MEMGSATLQILDDAGDRSTLVDKGRLRPAVSALMLLLLCSVAGNVRSETPADQEALARRLLNSQGCKACHAFEGVGGSIGNSLEEISRALNRGELRHALANPEKQHGKAPIADFSHLRTEELDALVLFLHGLLPEAEKTTPNLRSDRNEQGPEADNSQP